MCEIQLLPKSTLLRSSPLVPEPPWPKRSSPSFFGFKGAIFLVWGSGSICTVKVSAVLPYSLPLNVCKMHLTLLLIPVLDMIDFHFLI